jgi:hypothetical protein
MLCIEYINKRVRLFRLELSPLVLAILGVLILIWQLLSFFTYFAMKLPYPA